MKTLTPRRTDGDRLLYAVLEDPFDEVVRAVFRDWQEDHADDPRWSAAWLTQSPFHAVAAASGSRLSLVSREPGALEVLTPSGQTFMRWLVEGGLVRRVEAGVKTFMAHAGTLFSTHPVTEVALTDRHPATRNPFGGPYWWLVADSGRVGGSPAWLPREIGDLLDCEEVYNTFMRAVHKRYPTPDAATADLSSACVRHGRDLAGLPRLT